MEKKLKVGIIGCGGIANGKHLPGLKKVKEAEMVAFCDIVVERAEKAKENYGTPDAKVYADYKELLADASMLCMSARRTNRMRRSLSPRWKRENTLCVKNRWRKQRPTPEPCWKRQREPERN